MSLQKAAEGTNNSPAGMTQRRIPILRAAREVSPKIWGRMPSWNGPKIDWRTSLSCWRARPLTLSARSGGDTDRRRSTAVALFAKGKSKGKRKKAWEDEDDEWGEESNAPVAVQDEISDGDEEDSESEDDFGGGGGYASSFNARSSSESSIGSFEDLTEHIAACVVRVMQEADERAQRDVQKTDFESAEACLLTLKNDRAMLKGVVKRLEQGLIERGLEVRLLVLAALSREHLLLVGPPGTAKSALARRLAGLCGGTFFERLLTRFTTPGMSLGVCMSCLLTTHPKLFGEAARTPHHTRYVSECMHLLSADDTTRALRRGCSHDSPRYVCLGCMSVLDRMPEILL